MVYSNVYESSWFHVLKCIFCLHHKSAPPPPGAPNRPLGRLYSNGNRCMKFSTNTFWRCSPKLFWLWSVLVWLVSGMFFSLIVNWKHTWLLKAFYTQRSLVPVVNCFFNFFLFIIYCGCCFYPSSDNLTQVMLLSQEHVECMMSQFMVLKD